MHWVLQGSRVLEQMQQWPNLATALAPAVRAALYPVPKLSSVRVSLIQHSKDVSFICCNLKQQV